MNTFKEIIHDHIAFRGQILKLAKSDIVKTYRGAALGWAWAVIRPATTIFVFWFAFTFGLRFSGIVEGRKTNKREVGMMMTRLGGGTGE